MLRESLNVIVYMVGRGNISMQKQFIIVRGEVETEAPRFDNEIEVNADRLTNEEFTGFMFAMDRLFADTPDVSRKKISSRTHRTGRGNTRSNTSAPSGVSCRRMRSQVTTGCSVQNVKVVR